MKCYKSVLSFCLLLVAIRRANSAAYEPLTEKTVCKNSVLVQYTNFFSCKCEKDQVHISESECAVPVSKCTKADEICGEYSKCELDTDKVNFTCTCMEGYVANSEKPSVCVPKGCEALDKKCDGGMCIKKDDTTAQCGCFIGKKQGTSNDCVDDTNTTECKLGCSGDNTACEIFNKEFYGCGCTKDFEVKDGKCVPKKTEEKTDEITDEKDKNKDKKEEEDDNSASVFPVLGLFNVGLLFLVSSMVYVLV